MTLSELPVSATFSDLQEVGVFRNALVVANRLCDTRVRERTRDAAFGATLHSIQMSIMQVGSPGPRPLGTSLCHSRKLDGAAEDSSQNGRKSAK